MDTSLGKTHKYSSWGPLMNCCNKIPILILTSIWIILPVFDATAQSLNQEEEFWEIRSQVRSHWGEEKYDQAIDHIENNREHFSDGFTEFTAYFYLGLLHVDKGDYQKGFEELYAGMDKGYFYSFFPNTVQKIEQYPGSAALLERNNKMREETRDTAAVKLEVKLPEQYDTSQKYPLIIFLHGNNSSLNYSKEEWKDVKLEQPAIVLFVQSSSPVSSYAYNWPDSNRSRKDIRQTFHQIREQYPIDESEIVIAGFSAGGRLSVDAILRETIPAKGFIAFCPPKPQQFDNSGIVNAINRGTKGAIISGENDFLLTRQLEMATQFKQQEFPLRIVVESDLGHEYPGDFKYQLNRSLEFIFNQN